MTPQEKLHAAVVEFLESSNLDVTALQGFKLRAIVKYDPSGPWGRAGDPEELGAVNYYSTHDYLRRIALDAPTENGDLFAQ